MWVPLLDGHGRARHLADVLNDAAREAANSIDEEMRYHVFEHYDFRHAVVLVGERGPLRHSRRAEETAGELLVEWGRARGGTPVGGIEREEFDFGGRIGYAMAFRGAVVAPRSVTKLSGEPRPWPMVLRGAEEEFTVI